MPTNRTTATITIVAALAFVIMVVTLIAAPPNRAVITPTPIVAATSAAQNTAPEPTAVALATQAIGSDVQTTASGLEYRVVTEGTGPKPKATDTVTVNYRGVLQNGTEFDSSYSRNQPATFPLNQVIPGWTEGLQLMPVGSTYIFTIPPELAYGAGGSGNVIPPNATLVFQVELLSIAGQ